MATVSGITAERAKEIENSSIVDARLSGSNLILQTRGGVEINVGRVVPPTTPPTPPLDSWPVGSIFMHTTAVNPSTLLGGGTWVRWGNGRVPVGVDTSQTEFNAVEKTGGAKTHTLSSNEMPPHTHSIDHDHPLVSTNESSHTHNVDFQTQRDQPTTGTGWRVTDINNKTEGSGDAYSATTSVSTHAHNVDLPAFSGSSGSSGLGSAHNNLQPYITVYMWKRTA